VCVSHRYNCESLTIILCCRRIEQLQSSLSRDRSQRTATSRGSPDVPRGASNDSASGLRTAAAPVDDCSPDQTTSLGAKIGALCRRLLGGGDKPDTAASSSAGTASSPGSGARKAGSKVVAALGIVQTGPPSPDCAIKGNISSGGRIYHVPGGAAYEKTQIDVAAGERWFCSEADAQAAGWRRAKS